MEGISYGKINIFLKVTGKRGTYHEFISRFILFDEVYDVVEFVTSQKDSFTVNGKFSCDLENNSIYKAYHALLKRLPDQDKVVNFFKNHSVMVNKSIPEFGGLAGGPSNAATFLRMTNEACNLCLPEMELADIGKSVGADVPFFIHGFQSANVTGVGEVVEPFFEDRICLEYVTPPISCCTSKVFGHFRKFNYREISVKESEHMSKLSSVDVMEKYKGSEANDLYDSTMTLYPEMQNYAQKGWFMSGSGSTMFKLKSKNRK